MESVDGMTTDSQAVYFQINSWIIVWGRFKISLIRKKIKSNQFRLTKIWKRVEAI